MWRRLSAGEAPPSRRRDPQRKEQPLVLYPGWLKPAPTYNHWHTMPLTPGTRLGAYEITSALGAGGMGEVYKARDTRLDRSVAIKVLPSEFAKNAQLRIRFEREAKSISSLNHPHICTLYDVGHEDGVDYLVMELLDGQTLADRLSRGALPLADVIRYGIEIAEALEKAHRNGVVHRDLKPGNIMLTKSGAKLLDFGLAAASSRTTGRDPDPETPTVAQPITAEGTVVGTFQYMSPEQISGEPLDHRSDIFAFGAVLYEMVTGRRAFGGKNKTSVVAAILSGEPTPPSQIQKVTPPTLDRLIAWCLAKDPDARIQSAHDIALELSAIDEERAPRASGWWKWGAGVLTGSLLLLLALLLFRKESAPAPQETRFLIPAPPGTNHYTHASISPDGRRIVFRAGDAQGRTQLYLRDIASTDVRPLAGTEGVVFSFWAPDNRQIGFTTNRKLFRMNVDTGEIRTLASDITQGGGGAWGRDDVILYSPRPESTLYRVNAAGGDPVPETRFETNETHHVWPWFLPDGEHYLFMVAGSDQSVAGIFLGKLGSTERRRLIAHPKRGDFTLSTYGGGSIFYVRDFALMGQKFDVDKLELAGPPVKIDEGVELAGPGRTTLSSSLDGTILYRRFTPPVLAQLVFKDRRGGETLLPVPEGAYRTFALSRDEKKIAVGNDDSPPSSWIIDAIRGTVTRVPFERYASYPQWLPDGSYVVAVAIDTPPNIYRVRGESIERLTRAFRQNYATGITPDGAWLMFNSNQAGGFDINAVSMTPPHNVVPVLDTKFSEYDAKPSPDGKWIAYTSTENGPLQVFAMKWNPGAPTNLSKVQISTAGGEKPAWSKDGRELYYLDPDRTVNAVSIAIEDGELRPSVPVPLFKLDNAMGFEATRDGRFLATRTRLNPNGSALTVVQGWGR
jgi:eukaryotic-like serine/threonine-protein kinase